MSDTTTTLNPGTGGDAMDETLALQGDGSTTGKRPRVEIALAEDPGSSGTPKLVNKTNPLPVTVDAEILECLTEILTELRWIRSVLME